MQDRHGFNLFKFVKGIFTKRSDANKVAENKVKKSNKHNPRKGLSGTYRGYGPGKRGHKDPGTGQTPKLWRKMQRANKNAPNLKLVQMKGVLRRLSVMQSVEAVTPGRHTREIREHREWLAARGAR
jgi:hypothetical protein